MLYEATINAVTSKTVNRKSDGKTITIFEVEDSTGRTWATTRRDLANEAHRLLHQPVEVRGEVKQNGTYENFYLEDLRALTGQAAHHDYAGAQPQYQAQPQQPPQQAPQAPRIVAEGEGTPKDWTVWRQTATKVAAHTSQTPEEFWANVGQLITFYATGLMPELKANPTPSEQRVTSYAPAGQAQQAQQANQYVPEHVPNEPDPYPGTDDDIPF